MKRASSKNDDIAAFLNRPLSPDDERSLQEFSPWHGPLEKAESGDTQRLIERLRSETPLTWFARECIADLLSRRKLTKKQGGQRTPLYQRTEAEAKLLLAAMDVRGRQAAHGYDEAVNSAADDWDINPDLLDNYMKNKRGSSRRKRHG